ncbi:MAG TPA: hypothetical protein VF463_06745 [Sphingobium sp.]
MKPSPPMIGLMFWCAAIVGCAWVAALPPTECPPFDWHRSQAMTVLPPVRIDIALNASGELSWNGSRVEWLQLHERLQDYQKAVFSPIIVFRPGDDVNCVDKMRVRLVMNRLADCMHGGNCGEGPQPDDGDMRPFAGAQVTPPI